MNIRTLFNRLAKAGGKEALMAEAEKIDVGAIVKEAVAATLKEVVPSIAATFAESNKAFVEQITKAITPAAPAAEKKAADAATGTEAKPLTLEAVAELIKKDRAEQQASSEGKAKREQFAGEKLKDLPSIYRDKLGSDPAKWAAEEQAIREQYRADFKANGGTAENVGTPQTGGTAAAAVVDMSKLSATQLIAQGLKTATPARTAAAEGAAK